MKNIIKRTTVAGAFLAFATVSPALAQQSGKDDMKGMNMSEMSCCDSMAPGYGVINSVNLKTRKVNISHDPIKKIGWGEMTMDFEVGNMVALNKFDKGDNVHFMLKEDENGSYDITMMMPIGGDPEDFKKSMMEMMKGGSMMGCKNMEGMSMPGMSKKGHNDADQ